VKHPVTPDGRCFVVRGRPWRMANPQQAGCVEIYPGRRRCSPASQTQTSLGFFDLAIAAPSMKAALEAWGADSNLFHQGASRPPWICGERNVRVVLKGIHKVKMRLANKTDRGRVWRSAARRPCGPAGTRRVQDVARRLCSDAAQGRLRLDHARAHHVVRQGPRHDHRQPVRERRSLIRG